MRSALLALILFVGAVVASAKPTQFDEANSHYRNGDFAEAAKLYGEVVASGDYSPSLFYNLGNAEFRLGDLGKAALNYRRALALKPSHPEAAANLAFVQDAANAKTAPTPFHARFFPQLHRGAWTVAVAVFGWSALFLIAALVFARRRAKLWWGAACAILLCAYASVGAWIRNADADLGVVIEANVEARLQPTETASRADTLPPASEVALLAKRGPWTYCELPNGTRAWLPTDGVAAVDPPKS